MTPPSSGTVIPLMPRSQGVAAASKAWLDVWTDSRVTHGEARLAMRLFQYIDGKHFQATGQLLSYPGWDLLQEKTTLHRSSVARGLKKFESLGAIKIIRGGFDPKTGQRRPNQYLLIPPNQVAPTRPGNPVTRSQNQVAKPGRKTRSRQRRGECHGTVLLSVRPESLSRHLVL
jgi:hypothetical protein